MNYKFTLEYLPGKYMYIADLLTRNIIQNEEIDDESLKDLIHTVKVSEIRYSVEKLVELKLETDRDKILKRVIEYYLKGWPKKLKEESEMNHFFKTRIDLVVKNELVYFENRVVLPKKLRCFMLKQLHKSDQGVYKTKKLAKQHVYWPGIGSDINNLVLTCTVCNKYARSNKKNELMNHDIPDIPFDKVGVDIAHYGGKDYLIIVDYFSRWVEVSKLKWKTAQEIIKKCKKIFGRFGIPSVLIADNVPFNSLQFKIFSKDWGIEIQNSSPNYPRSNGLAEKYVGIVKNMFKKCKETNSELVSYLINYRNTPLVKIGLSPANLLQNRKIRTKLPIKEPMLENNLQTIKDIMEENQKNQKHYFDKNATKVEKMFVENEKVWVQDKFKKTWSEATIIKKLNLPRCYLIRDKRGRELRRNVIFLKKKIEH